LNRGINLDGPTKDAPFCEKFRGGGPLKTWVYQEEGRLNEKKRRPPRFYKKAIKGGFTTEKRPLLTGGKNPAFIKKGGNRDRKGGT